MTRETELKFLVDKSFEIPDFLKAGVGIDSVVELPAQSLSAIYYDTDDLRLARHGLTLRHRAGNGQARPWTLKLPVAGDVYTREEVNFEASPREPPAEAKALVTAFVRGRSLRPVTRLRTRRRRWSLMAGKEQLGELVDDHVSVLNGAVVVDRFREIEIETRGLNGASLKKLGGLMRRAGASPADPTPKAVRALGDRAGKPTDVPEPVAPSPDAPASEAVKMAFSFAAHRIIVHDAAARLGEVEGVHQMRVAVRRLRSDLRMFAAILDDAWTRDLKAELSWLADTLGAVRDADVLIARLRQDSQDLGQALKPLFQELEESHTLAAQALEAGLADERYTALLDRLIEASREPHCTAAAIEPCGTLLPRLVDKVWRRLASDARPLTPASPDEDLHAVRILAKRVRYASEMAAKCLAPNTARNAARFAGGAEEIQNILGDHQDTVIARAKLVDVASRASEQFPYAFALGQLAERQASAALARRERFFDSWKSFDKKGIRSWLSRRGRR